MIVLRVLGFLWSLPNTVFGLLWCSAFFPRSWRWRRDGWVLEVHVAWLPAAAGLLETTGETLGHLMMHTEADPRAVRAHERRHTWQSDILGPLFIFAYGAASLVARLLGGGWYFDNCFEADARRHAADITPKGERP